MRNLNFAINISADGFCGHESAIADEELHNYFAKLLLGADVLLYGRITYQLMVPYWPEVAKNQSESKSTNEFARIFDSIEKVVFSRTLKHVDDKNSRLSRVSLVEEARALKQKSGKDIYAGSLSIASQLSEHGLIDEYRFVVHPVVAGKGPRLFDTVTLKEGLMLELVGTEKFASGVVANHYRRRA